MRRAELADAHCLLVGDIDRGGVFASLFGTFELLDPTERARIHGFVINKFRGDVALLCPRFSQSSNLWVSNVAWVQVQILLGSTSRTRQCQKEILSAQFRRSDNSSRIACLLRTV